MICSSSIAQKLVSLVFCSLLLLSCGSNDKNKATIETILTNEVQPSVQDYSDGLSKKEREILSDLTAASDNAILKINKLLSEGSYLSPSSSDEIVKGLNSILIPEYSGKMTRALSEAFAKKRQLAMDELLNLTQRFLDCYTLSFGHAPNIATLLKMEDQLINEEFGFPFYACKGDTLYFTLLSSTIADYYIYNYDEQNLVASYSNTNKVGEYPNIAYIIPIEHSAIYVFQIVPKLSTYVSALIVKRTRSAKSAYTTPDVECVSYSECKETDLFARRFESINTINLLEEPRKVTLRSVMKSTISGKSNSLLSLPLPKGTTDVAYQLRLSRRDIKNNTDGQFFNNFQESYKQVKLLGIPVYQKTGQKTSLVREILNGIVSPPKEEDAYCDFYVYKGEDNFDSGIYDRDNSITQVQSSNGRIQTDGITKLYIKFDNVQVGHDIYVWVEAIATVPSFYYSRPVLRAKATAQ